MNQPSARMRAKEHSPATYCSPFLVFLPGKNGKTPPRLLKISDIVDKRFSSDPQIRAQGNIYAAKAKSILKQQIDHISLQNIQTCILVGSICSGNGDVDIESIFYGECVEYPISIIILKPHMSRQGSPIPWHNCSSSRTRM
jgi:hypothetical protein